MPRSAESRLHAAGRVCRRWDRPRRGEFLRQIRYYVGGPGRLTAPGSPARARRPPNGPRRGTRKTRKSPPPARTDPLLRVLRVIETGIPGLNAPVPIGPKSRSDLAGRSSLGFRGTAYPTLSSRRRATALSSGVKGDANSGRRTTASTVRSRRRNSPEACRIPRSPRTPPAAACTAADGPSLAGRARRARCAPVRKIAAAAWPVCAAGPWECDRRAGPRRPRDRFVVPYFRPGG